MTVLLDVAPGRACSRPGNTRGQVPGVPSTVVPIRADLERLDALVEAHLENGRLPRIEALNDLTQSHRVESAEHLIVR